MCVKLVIYKSYTKTRGQQNIKKNRVVWFISMKLWRQLAISFHFEVRLLQKLGKSLDCLKKRWLLSEILFLGVGSECNYDTLHLPVWWGPKQNKIVLKLWIGLCFIWTCSYHDAACLNCLVCIVVSCLVCIVVVVLCVLLLVVLCVLL